MNVAPETKTVQMQSIGVIHTPYPTMKDCPSNSRFCTGDCTIEVLPSLAEAMLDVQSATHLIVFYWLDQADRGVMSKAAKLDGVTRGVFATRTQDRPNPIGMSIVKLLECNGTTLRTSGVDCLDGTPLLDIKPYLPNNDSYPEAAVAWNKS